MTEKYTVLLYLRIASLKVKYFQNMKRNYVYMFLFVSGSKPDS